MKKKEFVFLPLGGASEIGMNCYLYGIGDDRKREWIMVDLGVKFADAQTPGVDLILPDLRYIEQESKNLCALVLTHAHEDHIGAIPWLWRRLKVPLYCTPFTAALLHHKLEEEGITGDVELNIVSPGARFEVGPFDLEFISVNHSIPEACSLVLRTSAGLAVHSGDWKIDPSSPIGPPIQEKRFREIGEEGVDALICDSTNVLKEGASPSELQIAETLAHIIGQARKRVLLTTFASHVGRLDTVARIAANCGREIIIAGRAMHRIVETAREVGLLKSYTFHSDDAFSYLPPEKTLVLCTGSQGEPRAAIARIAQEIHPTISLEKGDVVIFSSRSIPGNEKAINATINGLCAQGVEVITSEDALVHTSGHPRQEELKTLYNWLKPKVLVPMHGEMHHMTRHISFAQECGIPQAILVKNGEISKLFPGEPELIDEAPSGVLHVDGRLIIAERSGPTRTRRKLSFAGMVVISLCLDSSGNLVSEPLCVCEGIPEMCGLGVPMEEYIFEAIDRVLGGLPKARRRENRIIENTLKESIRRSFETHWGKKPICHVIVHRV